ncbi:MAG TPA: extensin family protein [Methylovirgula sp.]|nr:extensin family protein [Methylovirgula sp.]
MGAIFFACLSLGDVPLPPKRPPEFTPKPPPAQPAPSVPPLQPTPADNEALRAQVLASGRITAEALPIIDERNGCGIAAPLQVDAIILKDGGKVKLSPPAIIRASLASAVADWVRDDLAPALDQDKLTGIEGTGGYQCRSRNRIEGAKLSEHATGDALDLQAFRTEKNKRYAVDSTEADSVAFLALMKKAACARFSTVLGPGADSFHAHHLHLDLEARHHGTRLCQWTQDATAQR